MVTGDCMTKHNSKSASSEKNAELMHLEAEFAKRHRHDTDEELMRYLIDIANKLGHIPKKREIQGYALIKSRFGPWPRVLEKAGLKKKMIREEK